MDFLKTLLAYMAATFVVAVESTATPSVTPVPTPGPAPTGPAYTVTETLEPAATATPEPTVSVTPAPVPTITANVRGYHNLKMGDRGDEVRKLQQRLIELGYLPEGADDGAFGGQTRTAVRWFQYYNGLTVDGIAGRTTQTNLFENPDAAPMPTPEPTPEATPAPETAETGDAAGVTDEESDEGTGENVYGESAAPEGTDEPEVTPEAGENTEAEEAAAPAETAKAIETVEVETADAEENDQTAETAEPAEAQTAETGKLISSEMPTDTPGPAETEMAETEAAMITVEPTQTPEPTVTPYVAATPTQIPWGDEVETAAPAQETTAPAEMTETAEATETAEKTSEASETAETETSEGEPKNEDAEAVTGEIVEEINLDEPVPTLTPEPEAERVEYSDLAGWIVLNDGETPLQWTEEEDGVHLVRSPRMQAAGEDIRVSLDDLVKSIPDWTLYKEERSLILEAQGYTLGMLEESGGLVATDNGVEFMVLADDFSLEEGHFIRVGFLCSALDGEWEWNQEEETLFLRIPGKAD